MSTPLAVLSWKCLRYWGYYVPDTGNCWDAISTKQIYFSEVLAEFTRRQQSSSCGLHGLVPMLHSKNQGLILQFLPLKTPLNLLLFSHHSWLDYESNLEFSIQALNLLPQQHWKHKICALDPCLLAKTSYMLSSDTLHSWAHLSNGIF